jgi:glutamate-1-semialdehyde aminotransferase
MKQKQALDIDIYDRASRAIAHGALTNSKRAQSFVKGVYPTHLTKGNGCHVWDTNGNKYIDFICGLGSNLLGYANEEITTAITRQAARGSVLSLGTDLEVEVAEKVKELFPFVERLRFLKTGSDACSAAIKIARAATGRRLVLSEGYHGWHDEFVSLTPPANGVLRHPCISPLKNIETDIHGLIAAVIVEPIILDSSPRRIAWLHELRKKCTATGTLLIFDEVITGLRFPLFGVCNDANITPDLICLGKALGGGLPISVVAGKIDVMESDYFVSSTFAGETLSLAASLKTMQLLQTKYKLEHLWDKGAQFLFRFNEIWREGLILEGYPTRSALKGSDLTKALFMQECCKAGILMGPSFFFNFSHVDLMDETLSIFSDILMRIRNGSVSLNGEMPQKPYAQKAREST